MSIIKNIIWILAVLFVLASCSSEEDAPVNTNHDVTVSFTMSLGSPQTVTRAGSFAAAGDSALVENRLNVDSMQVVLYNTDGSYFSRVEHLTMQRRDATTYDVVGVMRVDSLSLGAGNRFTGKLVIYANTDASALQGDSLNHEAVQQLSYNYNAGTTLTSIPMWGVKAVDVNLTSGSQADFGEIWMLRAMAKVNVNLRSDMTARGYSLRSVRLTNYNTRGFVLPSGYSTTDNTNSLLNNSSQVFNPYVGTLASTGSIDFTGKTLYLPEYNNESSTATSITVVINDPDGTTRTATFPFAAYSGGSESGNMNIVRNHAYQFYVYGNPIKVDLTVVPWTVFRHSEVVL